MSEADAVEKFAEALTALHKLAGSPSRKQIADYGKGQRPPVKLGPSLVGGWLNGPTVPNDPQVFGCLVRYLQIRAKRRPNEMAVESRRLESLRLKAQQAKQRNRGGRPRGARARPARDDDAQPMLGRLISDLADPFALDVSQVIDSGATEAGLDPLPPYVERAHDGEFRRLLETATGGTSMVVVLVGEPATGKTRACWEAVQTLPAGWRLWHPISPERLLVGLDQLSAVAPRTVVWLNDAHHYLHTPSDRLGERVAASLLELLRDLSRAPILILATLWPGNHGKLTGEPVDGEADPHALARALLAGASVEVPDAFVGVDLDAARATDDPRLVEAVTRADQGRIIQYLAGVPVLIERYRTIGTVPKALIQAAIDARRLGYGPALARDVLMDASAGYLSVEQWNSLEADAWFVEAVREASVPCRGTPGPLTMSRPRPGEQRAAQPHYRLAPYLEQLRYTSRAIQPVPVELWQSLLTHAPRDALIGLGRSAQYRGLWKLATEFYCGATQAGHIEGARRVASLLDQAGRSDEALSWYARAVELGDRDSTIGAADMLLRAHRTDEAIDWYERAAEFGVVEHERSLARSLDDADRIEAALTWYARAFARGQLGAALDAAAVLRRAGQLDEAVEWCERVIRSGDRDLLPGAADVLATAGRIDEALHLLRPQVDEGSDSACRQATKIVCEARGVDAAIAWLQSQVNIEKSSLLWHIARLLEENDRAHEALGYYQRASDAGLSVASWSLARLHEKLGQIDEAIRYFKQAVEAGLGTTQAVMRLLSQLGRDEEALDFLRFLVRKGHPRATRRGVARKLASMGRTDEAVGEYRALAASGDRHALSDAAGVLATANRIDEAVEAYDEAAAAGDEHALFSAAETLSRAGRLDNAIDRYRQLASAGHRSAQASAADLLVRSGRREEALTWLRTLGEAGDAGAWAAAGDLLAELGDIDSAVTAYRRAVNAGDRQALWWASMLLSKDGQWSKAVTLLLQALEAGDVEAIYSAVQVLGDRPAADKLRRYGIEPGARIAEPWQLNTDPSSLLTPEQD